ncbi:MAG: PD-(D/E)XK nuclease family protein, partial [Candidatus Aenigmatarchaeota archaeon]
MKKINASWLRSYHWCPVQVKMYLEGIKIKSKRAEKGTGKHKSIEDTFKEKMEFEELPKEEMKEVLNEDTIVVQPEGITLEGQFKDYKVFGRPDMVFSEDGNITLIDFKTSSKMKIYDDVRLQMGCYLYLAKKEGLTNVRGQLVMSNMKKSKIKNKLSKILEESKIENRKETKNTVKKFLEDEKVFP